ncbi:PorP/SprF family type IX secretion system membrane protein [Galbibacter mesophilus]|uniref:PorP/SprF family type IX secretion system membrane protein n=1 Tax=Galbibacter mesophilus TaxID=379069 RepID=UPI00191CDB1B|nr:type IX secretion system membrane protein PorP/SprF [Galbibacter mesophilus]MCM5661853.1 type IX secretion system membrane protein PorP/SprF [Galbibacter mesophilus]
MAFFARFSAFALLVLSLATTHAQEGVPVYFDYLSDNYYLIHPSMAGASKGGKIRLTARKQWFDVERAPALQTLNANVRVGEKSGVGAILFNDRNGYHSQTGMKLTYAHHLTLSEYRDGVNQLSFGINVGFLQSRLDESDFVSIIPDPIITGTSNNVNYFNVDAGMSYHFLEFYTHFTVKNILGSGRDLYSAEEIDNLRRYLVSAGYVFGKNLWQVEPSFLLQFSEYTEESSIDLNAKVYREFEFGTLWGGLSYRRSFDGAQYEIGGGTTSQKLQLVTPFVGINLKRFMFSYNYSYQQGDIRFDEGGFHQITIGYDFLQPEKRYNCKCPAVN